jgi:methylglutaconyl-CoA hydratase/polyketide biosynthesis enoyl-CoA hydratase PksH
VDSTTDLERSLRAVAKQALRLRPESLLRLKRLCTEVAHRPLDEALGLGAACTIEVLREPETLRALAGYLAGEPLPWFARLPSAGAKT